MLLICSASSGENLKLAHRLAELAIAQGMAVEVVDLTKDPLPLFTPDREAEGPPKGLDHLEAQFARAQGMVFCAPEYNGSIPPTLTNAIAWLSTQSHDFRSLFNGLPLGLATHSGGGGQKVLVAMRIQFGHLGSNVIGRELLTRKNKPLNEDSARSVLAQIKAVMDS